MFLLTDWMWEWFVVFSSLSLSSVSVLCVCVQKKMMDGGEKEGLGNNGGGNNMLIAISRDESKPNYG